MGVGVLFSLSLIGTIGEKAEMMSSHSTSSKTEVSSEESKESNINTEIPKVERNNEIAELSDINKNESKVSFDDNIPVTTLFKDVFLKFADSVGISSFDGDKAIVDSLSEYKIEMETPTEEVLASFKIRDDKGDYVYLSYAPLNGTEILSIVSYNRNGYEISITDNAHLDSKVQYNTHNLKAINKNNTVSNINELANFMFVEIGDTSSKTDEKLDVFMDIKPTIKDGKVYFNIGTNLPIGTELMITLSGNDYTGQTKVTIKDGTTATELFSSKGQALVNGNYVAEVSMVLPVLQSNSVRDVIGNTGENMVGKLVEEAFGGDSHVVGKIINFSI